MSDAGRLAEKYWYEIPVHFPFVKLDAFVVMPDHIHGIVIIDKSDTMNRVDATCRGNTIIRRDAINRAPTNMGGVTENNNPMLRDNLSRVIRWYKGRTTFELHKTDKFFSWQSRFYDHIIRNEESFYRIAKYIQINPENWAKDKLYSPVETQCIASLPPPQRLRVQVAGVVQGVGFRPFVYRLARQLDLAGWVQNSSQGLVIECEGSAQHVQEFLSRLPQELPPFAQLHELAHSTVPATGCKDFEIRPSDESPANTTPILPDMATCPLCLDEIFDPANRRYLYPFANCTHCGPRYSIMESLPWDRGNTSMKIFDLCPDCLREYQNPADRRFHAQPNACPACGPQVALWDSSGHVVASRQAAITQAAVALKKGRIVALKGLGGFHLLADARNEEAVASLRTRKHRDEKPFAVMFPGMEMLAAYCEADKAERQLLQSPEAPIVLLAKKEHTNMANTVAPDNPYLGAMLPATPLHHILMRQLGCPVVATSGNVSDEPICLDEQQALQRLDGIADLFVVHNRPIVRRVDDSVARIIYGQPVLLRRARGYAPLPLVLRDKLPCVLGLGGHLKNTISLTVQNNVLVSPHIGDLETAQSVAAFAQSAQLFGKLYDHAPEYIACDLHPDYHSTQAAVRMSQQQGTPLIRVQHHHAHIAACMAENGLAEPVLGICWDGTGYAADGTIWGGEFLLSTLTDSRRLGHLGQFPLPGAGQAIREPRRAALGLLFAHYDDKAFAMHDLPCIRAFTPRQRGLLHRMLVRQINAPLTSSAGRLFDAVASLTGLRQKSSFEGQAACALEYAMEGIHTEERYPFAIVEKGDTPFVVDLASLLAALLQDIQQKEKTGKISAMFHNSLVEIILTVARRTGQQNVVLSGGCFQNRTLIEAAIKRLTQEGFRPFWHKRIPTNDGGIAIGQAVTAAYRSVGGSCTTILPETMSSDLVSPTKRL